jgi:uncharacterized repeat protein (TIGR01451 family)
MSNVINTASVKGSNTLNVSSQVSLQVDAPSATLTIVKGVTPIAVLVGQNLTYTIIISNLGPGTATSVVMEDTAPSQIDFDFAHATTSQGTIDSSSTAHYIKVNIGDIPITGVVTVTIPATAISV